MVICRKCNKQTRPDDFILDHVYKMVVCKNCVKDRQTREQVHKEIEAQKAQQKEVKEEQKPSGWDKDDDYLERAYRLKQQNAPKVERVDGKKVRYSCQRCKYRFLYDTDRRTPSVCPYCSTPVPKVM